MMEFDCDSVPNDSSKLDKRFPVETLVGVPAISLITVAPRTCIRLNGGKSSKYGTRCNNCKHSAILCTRS